MVEQMVLLTVTQAFDGHAALGGGFGGRYDGNYRSANNGGSGGGGAATGKRQSR